MNTKIFEVLAVVLNEDLQSLLKIKGGVNQTVAILNPRECFEILSHDYPEELFGENSLFCGTVSAEAYEYESINAVEADYILDEIEEALLLLDQDPRLAAQHLNTLSDQQKKKILNVCLLQMLFSDIGSELPDMELEEET